MSHEQGTRCTLRLGRSRLLALLVPVVHGGAACGVLACTVAPGWARAVFAVLALALGLRSWLANVSRMAPDAVLEVWASGDSRWRLVRRDGQVCVVEPSRASVVHPLATLLVAHSAWRVYHVPILADAVDCEAFRRLRAALRGY